MISILRKERKMIIIKGELFSLIWYVNSMLNRNLETLWAYLL
jgi:hypothetical protein